MRYTTYNDAHRTASDQPDLTDHEIDNLAEWIWNNNEKLDHEYDWSEYLEDTGIDYSAILRGQAK